MSFAFAPFLPILILFCIIAVRYWGIAILCVLVWAIFEGAVRKWVFPGLQQPLLLLKDVVLIFAYAGHLFLKRADDRDIGPKNVLLTFFLLLETMFCVVELLNPNSPSLVLSLYGLKNYIIYLPLALIMSDILKTREHLKRFVLAICLISLPVSALGVYQFSQPPSARINQYLNHEQGVENNASTFGEGEASGEFQTGRARTASTFSYIGGFVTFLLLAVPLTAALVLTAAVKGRAFMLALAALILAFGASATTGSRSPFIIFALAAILMVGTIAMKRLLSPLAVIRIAIGVAVVAMATLQFSGGAFTALEYRASMSDDPVERMFEPFRELSDAFRESPIIGYGIGTNSNASITIMGDTIPWWLDGYGYEGELARIMQEIGFVGFTLVYIPKILVIFMLAGYLRRSRTPLMIATHLAALVFVGAHLLLFTVNNPTGGLMYWAAIGVSIAAHRIELREGRQRFYLTYYEQQGFPLHHVALMALPRMNSRRWQTA